MKIASITDDFMDLRMSKVISLQEHKEENSPHEVAEVICLYCMNRWVSVHRQGEWLANWECPKCDKVGGIIYTGQTLGY